MIHDIVKMRFTAMGYLPNYPYHMISDAEMCDAFLCSNSGCFYDMYPLLDSSLSSEYETLRDALGYYMGIIKASNGREAAPAWVYSYMIGSVITAGSSEQDISYLSGLLHIDNPYSEFTADLQKKCYEASTAWLRKTQSNQYVTYQGEQLNCRPPTMFGESHVIKSKRVDSASPI